MTFQDCVLESLEHRELIQQFDRLSGTKVMDIFYDKRAPINRMIDEATEYDKARHEKLSQDLQDFLWFIYQCIWMRLPEYCRELG